MLKQITLKRYLITFAVLFVVAFIVQLAKREDCAWDGCGPTDHPTIVGSLFGLPAAVVEIAIFAGIVVWIAKRVKR